MALTTLQTAALIDLWTSSRGNGHDFGYTDDLPSISKPSRGGVIAKLISNGYITSEAPIKTDSGTYTQFEFTAKGRELFVDFSTSSTLRSKTMPEITPAAVVAVNEAAPKKAQKKAAKAAPAPAPKKVEKPAKATKAAAPEAEKALADPNRLGKPFAKVLQALVKAGKPLSRAQISEKTGINSGFTGILGHVDPAKQEPQSLSARKLIRQVLTDVDGKDVVMFEITATGRKALEKLPK